MNGQNQYLCEQLGKKVRLWRELQHSCLGLQDLQCAYPVTSFCAQVDAEKRTLIKQLPHTLVFHLKRFEWDYETYQRWKVRMPGTGRAAVGLMVLYRYYKWVQESCHCILPGLSFCLSVQVKDRFEFPRQLDMYPYTVEGADEADGRVNKALPVLMKLLSAWQAGVWQAGRSLCCQHCRSQRARRRPAITFTSCEGLWCTAAARLPGTTTPTSRCADLAGII